METYEEKSADNSECVEGEKLPVVQLKSYLAPVFSLLPPVVMETEASSRSDEQDAVAFLKHFLDTRRKQNRALPLCRPTKSREKFLRSQMIITKGEEALNKGQRSNGLPTEFSNQQVSIQAIEAKLRDDEKAAETSITSRREEYSEGEREQCTERVRTRGAKPATYVRFLRGKTRSTGARAVCPAAPNLVLRSWSGTNDEGPLKSGPLSADDPRYLEAGGLLYPPHHGL